MLNMLNIIKYYVKHLNNYHYKYMYLAKGILHIPCNIDIELIYNITLLLYIGHYIS